MMAPGNYRPDGSPIIGISPHRLTGQGGITNTLDLGGGQKIQDYLAGAGVSTQGPGGGTLYTAGGGTIPQGNASDLGQGIHNRFNNNRSPNIDPGRYPTFGDANLGFGSVENPLGPVGPGVGGVIPGSAPAEIGFPIFDPNSVDPNNYNEKLNLLTQPGPSFDNMFLTTQNQPTIPDFDPVADAFQPQNAQGPQQPTGGFDSKVFANELLTGIGDLFKQHFPDSAQMAFNNSNQPQSQIEQPIQDATTFDVQPQQNTAYNPFSVNTIGGAFGGGY